MQTYDPNPRLITDHNAEGFDSVDSEDFDPGFGCVVQEVRTVTPPPLMVQQLTDNEKWAYWYQRLTYEQIMRAEDEWLRERGVN